jgi:glucose/arabinose dehydrogenase
VVALAIRHSWSHTPSTNGIFTGPASPSAAATAPFAAHRQDSMWPLLRGTTVACPLLTTRRERAAPHREEVRMRGMHQMWKAAPSRVSTAAWAATLASLTIACSDATSPTPSREPVAGGAHTTSAIQCDPDNAGLTLPSGFCALVVARDVGRARHMAVRPNGDLYVAIDNGPGVVGGILALRDADGDGRPEIQARFGDTGGNGIAWSEGQLYFAPNDRVVRYSFTGDELVPSTGPVTIVSGLPVGGDHPRKTIVLDGRGNVYVNHGSASNSCQVANRQLESPGIDPCPELAVRAGIWRFSATATGQTLASGHRVATETRNVNALAINPADGLLYGAQNGRDQLFENWPNLFDDRDDALLPGEELLRIDEGQAYGWPYCYYDGVRNRLVLAPEYGGDGKEVGRCASRALPLADYPAHWAPLGMTFYTGDAFGNKYTGGLFIAFHGSRFDPRLQPAGPGYNVVFVKWQNGKPDGTFEVFADGFAAGDPSPTGAAHRPVSVAEAPDGSLYISDDKGGFVYRVVKKE